MKALEKWVYVFAPWSSTYIELQLSLLTNQQCSVIVHTAYTLHPLFVSVLGLTPNTAMSFAKADLSCIHGAFLCAMSLPTCTWLSKRHSLTLCEESNKKKTPRRNTISVIILGLETLTSQLVSVTTFNIELFHRLDGVEARLQETSEAFEQSRLAAKKAKSEYERVKKMRYVYIRIMYVHMYMHKFIVPSPCFLHASTGFSVARDTLY